MAASLALLWASVASAAVWTDQEDYAPGSVVTISGDNSNDAGYQPGETINVDVSGPNGWTETCDATADEAGAWSCQVTLYDGPEAVGDYAYTATGLESGTTEHGTFTDGGFFLRAMVGTTPIAVTFPTGATASTPGSLQSYRFNSTCTLPLQGWQPTAITTLTSGSFNNLTSLGTFAGGSNRLFAPATVTVAGTTYAFSSWSVVASGPNPVNGSVTTTGTAGCFSGWNAAIATFVQANYVVADATAPTVTVSFPTPDGSNGWFKTSPVVGSVTATDPSNVTAISCTGATMGTPTGYGTTSASASLTVSAQGTSNVSCSATDGLGNTGAATGSSNTATVMLDSVAPTLSPSVTPNPVLLNGSATATPGATDSTSGVASSSCGTVVTSSVGAKTVSCTATDTAGNTATANASYNVIYGFSGFFSPVDNNGVLNKAKAGQSIPLKWRLTDANGDPVLTLSGVTVSAANLTCSLGTSPDLLEEYAAGSSGLQNLGDGYYQFNWATPKSYANSCKTAKLNLGEGSTLAPVVHEALFQFTK